ncbi:hypothetical protein [Aquimarina agarivorans]|uniref:hypothetical protein n=1 Tax=Aquimarina agarivorans TaxID=980584 RepID=UPI000248FC60|nr:hypothetical protein [Aquimarina agarivorans]
MKTDIIKIILIVFGASGFWKFFELLVQHGMQKRLKKAEIRNLDIQANNLVVENWVQWSEKMEKRILQLENKNTAMNKTITKQRERINELQRYVDQLEEEIKGYKNSRDEH